MEDKQPDSVERERRTARTVEHLRLIIRNQENLLEDDSDCRSKFRKDWAIKQLFCNLEKLTASVSNPVEFERAVGRRREHLKLVLDNQKCALEIRANRLKDEQNEKIAMLQRKSVLLQNQLVASVGANDLEEELESHQIAMTKLSEEATLKKKQYARVLLAYTKQISHFKVLSVEQKIRIREARERDLEEEHQKNKVENVKKQIQKLAMLKDKLNVLVSMQNSSEESGNYQSAYLDFTIERIWLSMVILEQNIQNLEGLFKLHGVENVRIKMMECLEEAKLIIITISALTMDQVRNEELMDMLANKILNLELIGLFIPEVKMGRHLETLLKC